MDGSLAALAAFPWEWLHVQTPCRWALTSRTAGSSGSSSINRILTKNARWNALNGQDDLVVVGAIAAFFSLPYLDDRSPRSDMLDRQLSDAFRGQAELREIPPRIVGTPFAPLHVSRDIAMNATS